MKQYIFIIFLTIFFFTVTILYTVGTALALREYASAVAANPVAVSNLMVAKELISLDLRDIEVKDALKYIAQKANLNIVPTKEVSGRITLMINDAAVEDIFEIVIRSNSLAYEKIGSIFNVMTEKEYKQRYGKGFDDIRQVKVFHLKYVIPDQAYTIIDSIKSTIGKVLVEADSGTILVLDTPEKIVEITKTLELLEFKSTIRVFDLQYANAKDIEKQLKTQLDMKKVGSIKADERTNQLIVQTLPERMIDIEAIIKKLDQKTREVLIESTIIQIKLTDDLSQGVEWEGLFELANKDGNTSYLGSTPLASVNSTTAAWRSRAEVLSDTGNIGSYPFSGTTSDYASSVPTVGTGEMHIGVVGNNDYDVMLKYLKTLGTVKILSNPKLAVTNNQEARIHVGERQAYITTTTTAGQTTTTVSEEVTFLDVGLQLHITPTINDEGYVTLKIKPDLSSVIGTLLTAQNNRIPIVDSSTAETTVMIKDGATVAVGGLCREEKSDNSQEVPFLGKIPILGMLFKSGTKGSSRSELLIMVTAHIIKGDKLDTGDKRDFGIDQDKGYKDYNLMTTESDLTEFEKQHKIEPKLYQEYPEYKDAEAYYPTLKPLKDE
ncbi:MAG: secretin N-terminal domain-containing protein [Candidatus Omnitrophota bacterium]